jgi:quercetin dioxygenase-like cupin family protein
MTTPQLLLPFCLFLAVAADANAASERVEIDNPWVRVLRITQEAHEKTPMHAHPASVVVYLTDLHQKVTSADGKTRELQKKANEVAYFEAVKQAEENISDKRLEAVIVELRPGAPKAIGWPVRLDPVKLDPKHHFVPLENNRVRVLHTILDPHVKSPLHEHPSYVVVYLTELHTTQTLPDGRQVDNPRRPGEVAWRDALQHVTENIADRRAEEIQIELK